jgi:hypothetical protein
MKTLLLLALVPACLGAAPALEIVKPTISQMEGGTPDPAAFEHIPGENLYISCRLTGYAKNDEEKIHLRYSVQALDPKNVPFLEEYKNEMVEEVAPQDKEWMPRIATEMRVPLQAASGTYKILVKVEDVVGKTTAELSIPFQVRGRNVPPSDTLVVRNFGFYRSEDATEPLPKPIYRPGDGVWARFDIIGQKFGPQNKVDISYQVSILGASGKVLWTQPEPAVETSESFYPKRFIGASMSIELQKTVRPGEYTILLQVKDAIGKQSFEDKHSFQVE